MRIFFSLTKEDLNALDRMGPKSAENLINAIGEKKTVSMDRFLYSLGIRYVGEHVAEILSEHFDTLGHFYRADPETLESIEMIGPAVALSIVDFFSKHENRAVIKQMIAAGVVVEGKKSEAIGGLSGKTFVLTGSLELMTRNEAKRKIIDRGGKVGSSITRKTDYLVIGQSPGSKLDRAKNMGIPIIEEKRFYSMLDEDSVNT